MARHNKYDLIERVVAAINDSDWRVLYRQSIDEHPFRLQIYRNDEAYNVRIYIWHLTHGGGRARPKNEYRIQITGIRRFVQTPDEKTLVLGWWEAGEVFAGFDVRRHLGPLGSSPSIQIREEFLRQAYVNGFAPCDKGNSEIAIAFRPDFFVEYVRNLEGLHDFGQSTRDLNVLNEIAKNPEINDEDIHIADSTRKTVVVSVTKKLRDVNFRRRVLTAYTYRCAFCGIQLRLVEAAHIIPVNHEGSTDETRNGLALCALHHRAYDQALVTVDTNYSVRTNEEQASELRQLNLDGGWNVFVQNLRELILLPPAVSDRPHAEIIKIANQIRGWK